jgi:hypothetical protein
MRLSVLARMKQNGCVGNFGIKTFVVLCDQKSRQGLSRTSQAFFSLVPMRPIPVVRFMRSSHDSMPVTAAERVKTICATLGSLKSQSCLLELLSRHA